MTHSKDEASASARKETSLTRRRRGLAAAVGIVTAGVAVGAGIVTGAVEPEVAVAVAAVCGITAKAVQAVLRRFWSPGTGAVAEE